MNLQHCSRCKQDLPREAFQQSCWGKKGPYCRNCTNEYNRENRKRKRTEVLAQSNQLQRCPRCKQDLPQSAFIPSDWGYKGRRCRECKRESIKRRLEDATKCAAYVEYMRTANNSPERKLKDKLRITPAKLQRWKQHLKRQRQLKKQYKTKESEYLEQRHGLDTQYRVYLYRQQFDLAEMWEARIDQLQQEWDSWLQEFTKNPVAEKVIVKMALKREEQNHD